MKSTVLHSNFIGFWSLLFGSFLFSLFGVFTRILSAELGIFNQIFVRAVLVSIIFLFFGLVTKSFKKIKLNHLRIFVLRGVITTINIISFNIAVINLPLNLALFLFYGMSLVVSFLCGYLIFKEKVNRIKFLSLILALTAIGIIYIDGLNRFDFIAFLMALISGGTFGLTLSFSKKLTQNYSPVQVNLVDYAFISLLIIPVLLIFEKNIQFNLSIWTYFYLILFSVVTVICMYLILFGYKIIEVQKASLILLSELVFASLISFLFYKEILSFRSFIGCLLILVALSLPNLNLKKLIYNK